MCHGRPNFIISDGAVNSNSGTIIIIKIIIIKIMIIIIIIIPSSCKQREGNLKTNLFQIVVLIFVYIFI